VKQVLIFDYDGVLADSLDYFLDSFLESCRELGYERLSSRAAFMDLFETNFYDGLLRAGIPETGFAPLLQKMHDRLIEQDKSYRLFDGIPETIRALQKKLPLYIVTSNHSEGVTDFLARHDLGGFQAVLGSNHARSKVEKLRTLTARHPEAVCWYAGDTAGDLREARDAGVRALGAAWGWHGADRLRPLADRLIHHPRELIKLFSA
jgi:phosphoglycolate phosphatase